MAKQKGVTKYEGTIGDIRHFKIKGLPGYYAGLKGGPSAEQVKTAPEFERTRENMNEFGGCAKAGKSVRTAFSQLLNKMSDSQLTGRLTSIMKKINLEDQTEARGYRAIEISTQRQYLVGLDFDKNLNLNSIIAAPWSVSHNVARDSADWIMPAFDPTNLIIAPAGATHFRLVNAIGVVSDFAYNNTTGSYDATKPALNEVSDVAFSGFLDLYAPVSATTVTATIVPPSPLTADVTVIQSVGIEFYQKVGSNYYQFASGNSLKVVDAF